MYMSAEEKGERRAFFPSWIVFALRLRVEHSVAQ